MTYHLFSDTVRRAAKQHRCIWCGQAINKGDSYHDERSVYYGSIQRNRWHPECLEYARDDMRESGDQEFMPWSNERPPCEEPKDQAQQKVIDLRNA